MSRIQAGIAVMVAAAAFGCARKDDTRPLEGARTPAPVATVAPTLPAEQAPVPNTDTGLAVPNPADQLAQAPPPPQQAPPPAARTARAPQPPPPARRRPAAPPVRSSDRVVRDARPAAPAPDAYERDAAREARREPEPERPAVPSLPAGSQLSLRLETGLSSATSQAGDRVTARIVNATGPDGDVALPGGAVLQGHVVDARGSGRVSGRARLIVDFDRILVRGQSYAVETSPIEVVAESDKGRDVKIAGGATVAGAVIGAILGGGDGAKKGAVVGAAAGGGAVLATKGREVELPAGSKWTVRVKTPVRID
jgi:hypothetical protein